MAEKLEHYLLADLSGGVNQSISRLLMAENESSKIQNGSLEKVGSLTKVKGYVQRGATVNDGYKILGYCDAFKPSDGTQKQIVVCAGASEADAYTYNSTTDVWNANGLSLSAGSKAEFESFLDGFFMVNFTEATRFNDLTSWYTTTNVTGAARARYVKQYLSRLYLGYVVSGGTTYPSRVTYSDLPETAAMTIAWNDAENYFDVDADDGDVIKGLTTNGNRLLIFKEKSLYRYDTNTLYKVWGCPGTVSQRSVKDIEGWTLYWHSTGLWGYNGETSKLLSRRVQDLVEGVSTTQLADICAVTKGDHYYVYLGDIENSRKGLSISKCLLDYDIAKNAFAWWSLENVPTVFGVYRDNRTTVTYDDPTITYDSAETAYNGLVAAEQRTYFGTVDGDVFEFDKGKKFNLTDIEFVVETRDLYLNLPSYYKLLQKVQILVDGGQGIIVQFKMDDGDWKTLGRVDKTQSELIFPDASRCKRVKFRLMEMSGGDQFAFEGLDLFYITEGLIE